MCLASIRIALAVKQMSLNQFNFDLLFVLRKKLAKPRFWFRNCLYRLRYFCEQGKQFFHFDRSCVHLYNNLIQLQLLILFRNISLMDPSERKRKAPPLPKFQQAKNQDSKVVEKVADFLQQLSKQSSNQTIQAIAQKPIAPVTQKNTTDGDKKKFNLANISSKLNSIMSTKKIDLNKVVQNSKKATEQSKHRRDIQIQYDPANPNSYQQSKSHYTEIFQKLKTMKNQPKQIDDDEKISRMVAQFQRNGQQIEEQPEQIVVQQANVNKLDDKQSLALRMMQKFGFKIGQGLGKQSQGIKTPLTIKKLTDSSCRIEPSALSLANFVTLQQSAENALMAFKIKKSPVIALRVSMKLNQLTDEVESQIKEQCQKYGRIAKWVAFSTIEWIIFFCQYDTAEEAFKAFTRINGRYYDEQIINVFFYSQQLFNNNQLNEQLHQILQF